MLYYTVVEVASLLHTPVREVRKLDLPWRTAPGGRVALVSAADLHAWWESLLPAAPVSRPLGQANALRAQAAAVREGELLVELDALPSGTRLGRWGVGRAHRRAVRQAVLDGIVELRDGVYVRV